MQTSWEWMSRVDKNCPAFNAAHVKEIIEKRTARRTEFVRSVVQAGAAGRRKVVRMPANTSGEDPTTRRAAES